MHMNKICTLTFRKYIRDLHVTCLLSLGLTCELDQVSYSYVVIKQLQAKIIFLNCYGTF